MEKTTRLLSQQMSPLGPEAKKGWWPRLAFLKSLGSVVR